MTIPNENIENNYVGNGVATTFAYTFPIFEDADIVVTRADTDGVETVLTLNTDYTVTGAGLSTGGNVVLSSALASNYLLNVTSNTAKTQTYDIRSNPTYRPDNMERALDRQVRMIQEVGRETDKAVRLAVTQTGVNPRLPLADAGKLIGWKEDGTGLDNFSQVPEALVGSAMEAVMTASTLANARSLMGPWGDALVTATGGNAARSLANRFADEVNVKDYGAAGDGVTDDRAAIMAAIAAITAGATLFFPPGVYRVTSGGIPVAKGSFRMSGSRATLLHDFFDTNQHFVQLLADSVEVCGLTFASLPGYSRASAGGLLITNAANINVHDCTFMNGQSASVWFTGAAASYGRVANCYISNGKADGIHMTDGANRMTVIGNTVVGCQDDAISIVRNGGGAECYEIGIIGNTVSNCHRGGIVVIGARTVTVSGNTVTYVGLNSILAYDYGGGGPSGVLITGNTLQGCGWFASVSINAASIYIGGASGVVIKGNTVNPGTGALPNALMRVTGVDGLEVVGNSFGSCADDGMVFTGSASTLKNVRVKRNTFSGVTGKAINFAPVGSEYLEVIDNEFQYCSVAGGNLITANNVTVGAAVVAGNRDVTGTASIASSGCAALSLEKLEWTDYAPTVTPQGGAITSYAVNAARWRRRGKSVEIRVNITITNAGTGSGRAQITLPAGLYAASFGGAMSGRENGVTGKALSAYATASMMYATVYDGTSPIVTGYQMIISGIYELA